jgi:PAS domain S-box-containing protein
MLDPGPAIADIANSAFVSMDEHGSITYWSPRATEMFGIESAAALGSVLAETIMPERYRARHRAGLRHFLETGEGPVLGRRIEVHAVRPDGSEFPIELTIAAVQSGGGWGFHAVIQDLSERARLLAEVNTAVRIGDQRLETIIDSLAEAVTIRDRSERIVYANRAALKRLGFDSLSDLRRAEPAKIFDEFIVLDEHGEELSIADVPSVRLLGGQEPEPLLMHTIHRATGRDEWVLLKVTPLLDESGELMAAVTVIEDVTAAKRSELRLRFLAQASEMLASSLDYQTTLRNVARLAVPEIADWCSVDLVDEAGVRDQLAVAHRDPAKLELAERLRRREASQLDPNEGLGRVLRTGQPALYSEISDELLARATVDPEQLRLLREVGMHSALIVPLRVGPRVFGAMTLVNSESGHAFGQEDVAFAQQIADRAAVAVENARLSTARAQIASTLQQSLFPSAMPEIPGWELAALYRAAGEGMEVGGDFYDFFAVEEGWVILIGDVTGKGVSAAAMTSLIRHSARIFAEQQPDPASIMERLDTSLRRQRNTSLSTAACAHLTAAGIVFCSAGHPLPLVTSPDGVRELGTPGPMLGAFDHAAWHNDTIDLRPSETLLLYTDGVTDARGQSDRFGGERLRGLLRQFDAGTPSELLARLDAALTDYIVGAQNDDVAALALRREPLPASAAPAATKIQRDGHPNAI